MAFANGPKGLAQALSISGLSGGAWRTLVNIPNIEQNPMPNNSQSHRELA
jgi:hypothetical protein